jgi:DNA-binding MarR family transcriptional regulator
MDDLFFGVKRTHLAVNRWALHRLREFGVTPARFDLMRLIYERNFWWTQDAVRHRLGVARSTVSRMMRALEALGWMTRERSKWDRRTLVCTLTYEGRRVVASVMSALIWPRVIMRVVDEALRVEEPKRDRDAAEWLFRRLVNAFAMGRGALFLSLAA